MLAWHLLCGWALWALSLNSQRSRGQVLWPALRLGAHTAPSHGCCCSGCCAGPLFPLSKQLGIPSCVPSLWEACHSQSFRRPSYPFVLPMRWEKPEQSCGAKCLGLRSKTCCCDALWRVLFSMFASFLGAFLGVCLNFNWFPLTVLKFYKPPLVNPLILAGSNIAAEDTEYVPVIRCVSGPFCGGLSFLANITTSVLIGISLKWKEGRRTRFFSWHEEASFKYWQKMPCASNSKDT